ncbi:FHA domain-containing protein [Ornithinimicrobium pratense]|uniref:FHA domain-containing protein n=1 Tax=Ornithinimicrobium pratense TaxID=2593973 RepID=A0A5J6VA58_9MICO|nr:FHA domain-containing protein [Ornithinimicrobium pratense]
MNHAAAEEPVAAASREEAADAAPRPVPASEPQPEPEPRRDPEPPPPAAPSPADAGGAVAAHVRPRHTPPSRVLSDTWVVEVWIDPDWYAVQQTEEACPSPGLPDIVVVHRNVVLIGRPSGSLGVRPDVDAGADSAVSRRHAQLTSDGSRWWIEDLGSSNGTYVGSVGEPPPTEPIRQRVEIDRDDRIYVGAWTRLVLRQATASEQAGQG